MKKIFLILAIIVVAVALPFSPMLIEMATVQSHPIEEIVKEGDVIFQTSQSQQSPLIQIATRSHITHCGIVVIKNGKPYVLETLKTLVLTPLDKFVTRGKDGKYWLKRSNRENIKIEYAHYLGKPYDLAFSFDNNTYYCSELVYDIYKNQLGIELCEPKQISDYLVLGIDKLDKIKSEMKRRGITNEQYAVAPVDVFRSDKLKMVKKEPQNLHANRNISPTEVSCIRFAYMPMGATTQFPIETSNDLLHSPHKDTLIYDRKIISQYVSNINELRPTSQKHVKDFRIVSYLEFANTDKRVFISTDDYADIYVNGRRMLPDSAFVEYLNQLLNRRRDVSFEEMRESWNVE